MPHFQIHASPYVPALEARLARRLWADGVYARELLAVAARWTDLDAAWRECVRLELVLPLAHLRGAEPVDLARVARLWVLDARERLGALGWPTEDRVLASNALSAALAPDVDLAGLSYLRDRLLERAGRKAEGRHRYRLLNAIAHTATLGIRRLRPMCVGAGADGAIIAEHLLGALEEHDAGAELDLFQEPAGGEHFDDWARTLAHELLADRIAEAG